jgi:hypothetical protein
MTIERNTSAHGAAQSLSLHRAGRRRPLSNCLINRHYLKFELEFR